ncbi:hypothetical protein TVAG_145040 [Trichomonas vaginalis G3]|uniref:Uncharacterized protein n=1 Tax=Trichomonas vaginalis (strain ATCC PRA-98 / G3) TaxID=412133 RepID=A2G0C1_TRIV3|nr:hypothetical protein TVAGG3_0893670 [Trichomonas vaginalis G3]EAX89396.1 hypothetical protein TVAG_145040 [Trichomonas vaginalis G3]KAI5502898.1 hypothetical protein TVAGG3_0893670 [Trichomonas vaginalis G3]|eukprot:XP_001302326.1 hypothetical protein [Trichomonas vaginalis G3]
MNDLEPFARALLEKRRGNRQQIEEKPQNSPPRRRYEVKETSRSQINEDVDYDQDADNHYQKQHHHNRKDVRRRREDESEDDSEIDQYKQIINALKNKNRSLKTKILLLQNELQDLKQREDENDPYLASENEDLRAQLKQERINNKLSQERIRVLENDIKSKEQIIKTKDLMIVHLQNSCKEQANEYAKVADQLKNHVSGFNVSSKSFSGAMDNTNDYSFNEPKFNDPAPYPVRNNQGNDDFNDFEKPSFNYNQGKDDFMDAFEEPKKQEPPAPSYGFNDRNFDDKFDNFSEKPTKAPEPFERRAPPPQRMDVPDGFQGGNYSEDMPVGGGAARMAMAQPPPPQQDRFSRQPPQQDNFYNDSFDSYSNTNAEDIRKEIDKLLPRKAELERKLNLVIPKGGQLRDRDAIEEEFDKINKQISRLKLKLRQMAH